jgi:hypothetical protein
MEKDFDQLNYYEMLDIKPDATALEIRSAYNAACKYINPILWSVILFFRRKKEKKYLPFWKKLTLRSSMKKKGKATTTNLSGWEFSILRKKTRRLKVLSVFLILTGRGIHLRYAEDS